MELCREHAWIVREDSGCLGSANLEVLKLRMGDEDSRPDGGIVRDYIGMMEKKMETSIIYWGNIRGLVGSY